jgi:hypothetical protein
MRDTKLTTLDARSSADQHRARWLGLSIAVIFSVIVATVLAQRPLYNWDLVPYVAIALKNAGEPADSLRQKTFDTLKRSVPDDAYEFLSGGSEYKASPYNRAGDYRFLVAHDSKIFSDQLPLYAVKPVYPALMSLLSKMGINPVTAAIVISATAYVAICLLLYVWMSRWLPVLISLPMLALFSLNPFFATLPQFTTPDPISVFTLLLGTFLIFETKHARFGALAFTLAVLVRPENIIYAVIFQLYELITRRIAIIYFFAALCAAFAVYFTEVTLSHNYGWQVLFYFTFFDWKVLQNPGLISLSLTDYVTVYAKEFARMILARGSAFPLFVMAGFGALLLKLEREAWRDPYVQLLLLTAICAAARTLAFPGESERSLVFAYMLTTLTLIEACAALKKKVR